MSCSVWTQPSISTNFLFCILRIIFIPQTIRWQGRDDSSRMRRRFLRRSRRWSRMVNLGPYQGVSMIIIQLYEGIKSWSRHPESINQWKIEKPKGPALPSTMKLLIVLGLFPLFSAQQFGSFPQGYNNNNNPNNWPGFDFSNNNNNYNNNQWAGFDFSSSERKR